MDSNSERHRSLRTELFSRVAREMGVTFLIAAIYVTFIVADVVTHGAVERAHVALLIASYMLVVLPILYTSRGRFLKWSGVNVAPRLAAMNLPVNVWLKYVRNRRDQAVATPPLVAVCIQVGAAGRIWALCIPAICFVIGLLLYDARKLWRELDEDSS